MHGESTTGESTAEDATSKFFGAAVTGGLTAVVLWTLLWPSCQRAPQVAPQQLDRASVASAPQRGDATALPPAAAGQAAAVPAALPDAAAQLGPLVGRSLPTGVQVQVPVNGVEGRLLEFIADPAKAPDRTTWFDFDRLLFDTGKATLRPESQDQLRSVAEILKAYPPVKLKIGGYTDDTGDAAFNQRLSDERASNVRGELVALGVAAERLESEGYGAAHPVADNATAEGRARNRRISMRVLEK